MAAGETAENPLEQAFFDTAVIARRMLDAGFEQFLVSAQVQCLRALAGVTDPRVELPGRHHHCGERLSGKAIAVVLRVTPPVLTGAVRHQVQLRGHAGHGVNLPGQLRDHEGLHHRAAGELEAHRAVLLQCQVVEGGDALLRVDEEELPDERRNQLLMDLSSNMKAIISQR